jgi:hypothetical protein
MKLALLPPNQICQKSINKKKSLSLNKQEKKEKSFQDCPKSLKEQEQKKKSLK